MKAAKNLVPVSDADLGVPSRPSGFEGAATFEAMPGAANAGVDEHDGEEVNNWGERASLFQEAIPELNDEEFILAMGAAAFKVAAGSPMLYHPKVFIEAVSNLL